MPGVVDIMIPTVALIAIGYLAPRAGRLTPAAADGLGRLVFSLGIPVLLCRSLAFQDLRAQADLRITLVYFGGCFLILVVSLLLGRRLLGLDRAESGLFGLSAMYSNSSLLGVPIVQAAFGTPGLVLLGKIIVFHSLLLLPATTLIVQLGRADRSRVAGAVWQSIASTLCNPIVLGLLAGAAWSLTGEKLWAPLDRVTDMLAQAATPMALLALGAMQGAGGMRQIRRVGVSVALKLLLHPALVYTIAIAWGGLSAEAVAVATITAALPAGMNVYLLAQQNGCYVRESTLAISVGTLLSMLSLSAVLQLTHG